MLLKAIALLALSLGFIGCGSSESPATHGTQGTATTTTTTTAATSTSSAPSRETSSAAVVTSAPTTAETASAGPKPTTNTATVRPHQDCDAAAQPPRICVSPSQTRGAVVDKLGCRDEPNESICRACRPVFVGVESGRCCYEGLSRLPACDGDL
ncbi:MAG: hypothetical protein U0271_24095 [Polyangiaceae bacterium]